MKRYRLNDPASFYHDHAVVSVEAVWSPAIGQNIHRVELAKNRAISFAAREEKLIPQGSWGR